MTSLKWAGILGYSDPLAAVGDFGAGDWERWQFLSVGTRPQRTGEARTLGEPSAPSRFTDLLRLMAHATLTSQSKVLGTAQKVSSPARRRSPAHRDSALGRGPKEKVIFVVTANLREQRGRGTLDADAMLGRALLALAPTAAALLEALD